MQAEDGLVEKHNWKGKVPAKAPAKGKAQMEVIQRIPLLCFLGFHKLGATSGCCIRCGWLVRLG